MKTIFIPIFQGVEARNILRTDVFSILNQKNIRLILFVNSIEKKEYFEKEFYGDHIIYQIVHTHKPSLLNRVFSLLKFNLINTTTIDLKRRMKYEHDHHFALYFLKLCFNRIFARRIFRKMVRFFDYLLAKDSNYSEYFDKYKPDLVFLAHLFGDDEISLLREAKTRKIKTIGLITSWDKITGRCMIRLLPDKLIVYNDMAKEEAIRFVDMKSENIIVVGVPQYDFYFHRTPKSRDEFCRDLNISSKNRIIVFAPSGRERGDADRSLIRIISNIINTELIDFNIRLIVRFPPNDRVDLDSDLLKKNIIYQKPGYKFSGERGVDWDMNFQDLDVLVNTLYHCAIVISLTSSIAIDAAIFDKPIINIKFDNLKRYPIMAKPVRYFETAHYLKLLKTNGISVVHNEEELSSTIRTYMENKLHNSLGRKKIIKQQCWLNDGMAGKRMAGFILNYLN